MIQGLTEIGRLQTGISSLFLGTAYFSPPYLIFPTIFIQAACPIISQDHHVKSFWERDTVLGETHANGCTLHSLEVGSSLRLLWHSARLLLQILRLRKPGGLMLLYDAVQHFSVSGKRKLEVF